MNFFPKLKKMLTESQSPLYVLTLLKINLDGFIIKEEIISTFTSHPEPYKTLQPVVYSLFKRYPYFQYNTPIIYILQFVNFCTDFFIISKGTLYLEGTLPELVCYICT